MKEYFQVVIFFGVLSFVIANAISIHELGEQVFRYYAEGASNVGILMLVVYCFNKHL